MTDSGLRYIVGSDILPFEPDPAIEELLCQRVKEIDRRPDTAKNSLFEIILPLFSLKQIELKMTVISLVLFIMAGIGPTNNQAPKNNLNLFFLADTLSDTSVFQLPSAQDPAGKIYYK